MATAEVARLTLRQNRRGAFGWIVGVAALTLLYSSSYKSIGGAKSAAISSYPASLKQALNLQDLTSPVGYLNATVFGIPLLLLTTIYVVSAATRSVAGDEESGALDLILAYPVSRSSLVLARMLAMVAVLVGWGVVLFGVVLLLRAPTGLSIGVSALAAETFTWLLLGCSLAGISLLISAAIGHPSNSLGIAAGVMLLAYLADSFIPLIDGLAWVRNLSPYYWFVGSDALSNGLSLWHCALLAGTAVAATALAAVALNRRDIGV
ncbi:ABC-2 type transport system permease protein [Jatrophihabitans sp. GAS493]|uniref:ABC transporter permease n=1 Tax=Jatrophihabitans sp. GAS493 TaxID=1907575 RepID=UPI000BB7B36C|nr:ABC transporter permease subunit [Jatrophihabitans sp. GAS493]SOD71024.1 ABC-2 type transport system permease protein [Jatrophihabitans sp. GAS493]